MQRRVLLPDSTRLWVQFRARRVTVWGVCMCLRGRSCHKLAGSHPAFDPEHREEVGVEGVGGGG